MYIDTFPRACACLGDLRPNPTATGDVLLDGGSRLPQYLSRRFQNREPNRTVRLVRVGSAIEIVEGLALKEFPKEWIEEYIKPQELVLPNADQSNTTSWTSVKRELDDLFDEDRISKRQK